MKGTRIALAVAWLGGCAASLMGVAIGLALGPSHWSLVSLVQQAQAGDESAQVVLFDVRLPRVIGAWLVGASLALAGALLQTATHNMIADPYLVGTSAGATLAAVLAVPLILAVGDWTGWPLAPWLPWLQPLAAFAGSLAAVSVAFRLARRGAAERILVAGLVITAFAGAGTSFVLTRLSDQRLRAATHWLMGGVGMPDLWAALPALAVVAATLLWALRNLPQLEALGLGDQIALGLGVDAQRLGRRAVWWASALSAVAVSLAGIVGFVGLLVPNGLRMALGRDQRALLPASVLFGGGLLALLDGLSRSVVAPAELPLGVLTALAGCPLLYLLLRQAVREPALPRLDGGPVHLGPVAISATGLTVRFGDTVALDQLDLAVPGPGLVVILGENGSGKSTLLRTLAGLHPPTAGTVSISGIAPRQALAAGHTAWLPQTPAIEPGLGVRELVALGRHAKLAGNWMWRVGAPLQGEDARRVDAALAAVGLSSRAELDIGSVSGGERQRALVAMVLAQGAPILLLDEPTASLDAARAADLFVNLRTCATAGGCIVVVATHDARNALAYAHAVVVLAQGKIRALGPPGDHAVRQALAPAVVT